MYSLLAAGDIWTLVQGIFGGMNWQQWAFIAVIVVLGIRNKDSIQKIFADILAYIGKKPDPTPTPTPTPIPTPTPGVNLIQILLDLIARFVGENNMAAAEQTKAVLDQVVASEARKAAVNESK